MTTQAFNQGLAVLSKVFPKLEIDARFFWDMLNDLDGQYFLMAVMVFIRNTPELYPGTNLIAIIRKKTEELRLGTLKDNSLKLEAETEKERIERWQNEAVPMPQDCVEALTRLGIKAGGGND